MGAIRKACSLLAFLLWLAAVHPGLAHAASYEVRDVRYWSYPDYTRVVLELSGPADFTRNRLSSPPRLYLDLKGGRLGKGLGADLRVSDGILKRIRASQFDSRTVRVVLDLGNAASFEVFSLEDPSRIVIDVFGASSVARPRKVVLDAGHGGKDPGAIGPGGLMEKDVVLDVALKVKEILSDKGYEVVLTRDSDRFLSLEERTVIANREDADLFVSIHANANRKRDVKGIETYLLNWTDDEEAVKVAARENAISVKRMHEARSELGVILASLELQNKRDESLKLAHLVQGSMVTSIDGRYGGVVDNGVKQALFYVLFGARMPSVLVEVSYITNYEEASRLGQKSYRWHLARGIASGIEGYFSPDVPNASLAKR
ncbi:MAG: N-acetylmuramoyl-L-alanine amidase [Thermodesulfovibrionales bacterium]